MDTSFNSDSILEFIKSKKESQEHRTLKDTLMNVPSNEDLFIQKGWECPKCGRVYSPITPMCLYCGNKQINKKYE